MSPTARRALPIALALASVTVSTPSPAQTTDCITAMASAAQAARAARWRDTIRILEAARRRPACAGLAAVQTFSLARAVEQLTPEEPARACEALALYREVLDHDPDPAVAASAREGAARTDPACTCRPPDQDLRPGRWARAERKLKADIARDICRDRRPALRLTLAEVVEQLAVETPRRACEAQALYEASVEGNPDRVAVRKAGAGARRMKLVCQTVSAPAPPPATPAVMAEPDEDPDPERRRGRAPHRIAAWVSTIGAGALLASSGALFYLRSATLDDRSAARADYLDAYPDGDRDVLADAAGRHQRADEQAQIYEIAAWSAVGLGAALAATATWLWLDDGDAVTAALGPGHAGVIVRF